MKEKYSTNAKRLIHDKNVDDLVIRLLQKPGFLCPNREYHVDDYRGELDVHKITRNSSGKVFNRYYEVKWKDNSYSWRHAKTQFRRHAECHEGNWSYIYITPERIKRYKI